MDKQGYMTLSVSAIYERDLINADALTIVEVNPKGAVVTTSRNDVDYVVTTGKAVLLPPKESVDKLQDALKNTDNLNEQEDDE